jgi:CRISPR-associated protein Csb2
MSTVLLISVRFHEGRYHGTGDWPPSPARLFQALIAGAGLKGPIPSLQVKALEWLEKMPPPLIAAHVERKGQQVGNFVPNNDLDAVGGDPRRIGSIRGKKVIRPLLFDAEQPLLYAWNLHREPEGDALLQVLCQLVEGIYQLGRGIDQAWAWAEVMNETDFDNTLESYSGRIHRPSVGGEGTALACPTKGSFLSLEERYAANQQRFEVIKSGRSVSESFRQLPKPRFQSVVYDSPSVHQLYDLRNAAEQGEFQVWDLDRVCVLIQAIRDTVRARLDSAFPSKAALIEHWLIGRKPDGSTGGRAEERIRIIPIPSIGHTHADYCIRRVFIEIPTSCPIRADDLCWAFNGVQLGDNGCDGRLSAADDATFLQHYGVGTPAIEWHTVTPAALPESAKRRRIEPSRKLEEAKNATERAQEQHHARAAVVAALRHSGITAEVLDIVVQREPFQGHGARAEAFAPSSRFAKERLWHVAVVFAKPVSGPLALGDGRFLGLGVLAPCTPHGRK